MFIANRIISWTKFSTVFASGPNQCLLFVLTTYLSFSDKLCCRRLSSYNEQKPGKNAEKHRILEVVSLQNGSLLGNKVTMSPAGRYWAI